MIIIFADAKTIGSGPAALTEETSLKRFGSAIPPAWIGPPNPAWVLRCKNPHHHPTKIENLFLVSSFTALT